MYGKLVNGELEYAPDTINKSIKLMKDNGYKPVIDTKPGYDVDTQDCVHTGYIDNGRYIRFTYEVVEIEPTENEQIMEQTNLALGMFNVKLDELLPTLTDEQALQVPLLFGQWEAGKEYEVDDRIMYNGILYKVLQAHTSQDTWQPDVAPSLFAKVLVGQGDEILDWEQPDSTNPYMIGDKVKFDGKIYESVIDNNVWSPSDYPDGWQEVTE